MRDAKATLMCKEIHNNIRTLNTELWTVEDHWVNWRNKSFFKITQGLPTSQCCQSFLDSLHTFNLSSDVQAALPDILNYIDSIKGLHTVCKFPHVTNTKHLVELALEIRKDIVRRSDILLGKIKAFWPQAASVT